MMGLYNLKLCVSLASQKYDTLRIKEIRNGRQWIFGNEMVLLRNGLIVCLVVELSGYCTAGAQSRGTGYH